MQEANIAKTLAFAEDFIKPRREELQLVLFDWMKHLHRDLMVPVVILCPLMVSCYPDISKRASPYPVLQVQHARVNPWAYLAWTGEDHPVEIGVLLKQHVLECISGLGVRALACHACKANFTITKPNSFLAMLMVF